MFKRLALGVLTLAASAAPSMAAPLISSPGTFSGGNVSIQTQSGTSCSSQSPDRASVGAAAGYGDDGGAAASVFVAMPFGGSVSADCRAFVELEEQRARLDMAVTLFEAGALDADELREIAEDVKQYVQ